MLDEREELPCWIIDESSQGMGLETRKQIFPCPLEKGATYWMRIKPSSAKSVSWVAATIRHFKEKNVGSGIYKIGVKLTTNPPAELGKLV